MRMLRNKDFWQEMITKLTVILIYAFLYSIALNLFWQPGRIYAGGITGLSQIISTVVTRWGSFYLPISVIYYVLNIPLFILAWFKLNRKLVIFMIVSVTSASFAIQILPSVALTTDPIICAIFGGAVNGFSLGLALKYGLSTGGLDIVIIILRKWTGQSVGAISMIINGLIVLTAGYLFGWPYAFYSLLSIIVSGKVTDLVYVKHQKVQVMIITQKPELVIPGLQAQLTRGITIIPQAEGAYDHQPQTILITIITYYEMELLEKIMKKVDPHAFVSVSQDVKILSQFKELDIV
ncbi:YitT family protein [Enterococcus sp. BWB1-3]|uniref:YitT family protein n=1 Tax=unclassified Enterococcus TaxID=2608891 RepID=UPI001920B1D2|nr:MULTISPECIES: YitT family protein [unclassified Enterococcus]MBL1230053.1 YitT family protein [Enterococcus sp. BWB1-3]MCB5955339.1 YitT family protein [Enterococcus sp. CWB-B31]